MKEALDEQTTQRADERCGGTIVVVENVVNRS